MVRAQGISDGKIIYLSPRAESSELREPAPGKYNVYRLEEGMPEKGWTKLAEVTDLSYTDSWSDLDDGKIYRYAVEAQYAGDNVSEATLSAPLPKGMEVAYTISLSTNTGDSPEGTVVTLTGADGNSAHIYTITAESGTVTFPTVWRGIYDLSLNKPGYDVISVNDININNPGLSGRYVLVESIKEPYNLKVAVDGSNAMLSWNNAMESFFDDMEGYDDFIIRGIGDYTLYDGDGQPSYWFNDIYFSNMGYVGSWIVMNPSQTSPASNSATFLPYSGNKYLACMSTRTGHPNDDWLILPKVRVNDGSLLKFAVQNFTVGYDIARLKVGVSVSGTEPADFNIISDGEYIEAPYGGEGVTASWEELSFDLSAFAGNEVYIAIACVSDDLTSVLMIDDIEIVAGDETRLTGKIQEGERNVSYTVYIDGTESASGIKGKEHLISALPGGIHTAGVRSVYRTGESSVAELEFSIDDSGVVNISGTPIAAYIDSTGFLHISSVSEISEMTIHDMQGHTVHTASGDIRNIDMRRYTSGVYMLRVTATDGVRSFKLFKK